VTRVKNRVSALKKLIGELCTIKVVDLSNAFPSIRVSAQSYLIRGLESAYTFYKCGTTNSKVLFLPCRFKFS
jgi:hypothetical protein